MFNRFDSWRDKFERRPAHNGFREQRTAPAAGYSARNVHLRGEQTGVHLPLPDALQAWETDCHFPFVCQHHIVATRHVHVS